MKSPASTNQKENPEMTLAWLLRDINQMAQSNLAQSLVEYGLYIGQPRILRLIHDYPGETQKQIADRLYVSAASLSISLKRLQKAALVERRQSAQDRRRHELYLTPAGAEAIQKCGSDLCSLYRYMMSNMDEKEVQQLLESLKKIHDNLAALSDTSVNIVQTDNSASNIHSDNPKSNFLTGIEVNNSQEGN